MSFLNALASDGLSVGLRFYNARFQNSGRVNPAAETWSGTAARPAPATVAQLRRPQPLRVVQPPQSPEEKAAGRAEAQARLSGEATLGQLQSARAAGDETQAASAGEPSPEEQRKLAILKEREAQIKSEVQAAVREGVPGADSVQYTYSTGPDGQRYVSGLKGGSEDQGHPGVDSPAATENSRDLTEEEQQQVQAMQERDREVRTHEQAHISAAAGLAGAPVYEYQTGPDGRRYAVGGHVDVRTSGSSDPDTALREAEAVKRAAMAPAEPSGPDRAAAARASARINQIRAEKAAQRGQDPEETDQSAGRQSDSFKTENREAPGGLAAQAHNGDGFSRQALGAYSAVKLGTAPANGRPVLARA
ncbi:MAG: hypothetical protein LBP33_05230 [Candidatus Adiutrix sp.]|jgi:hypothetical protein|nr:hypothetical protein [Candidatus Adiutrix sp.]